MNNNAIDYSNKKIVVTWRILLGFLFRNIVYILVCCLATVLIAVGLNIFLYDEDDYQTELRKWEASYNSTKATISSQEQELSSLNEKCQSGLVMNINPNSAITLTSYYKIISENQGYYLASNGDIISITEKKASDYASSFNSVFDLQAILGEASISNTELSEVIVFDSVSDYMTVTVFSSSEDTARRWDSLLSKAILESGDFEKASTTIRTGFNQDLFDKQSEIQEKINELSISISELQIEFKQLSKTAPHKYRPVRSIAYGLMAGLVLSFFFFSYLPAFSGIVFTSKEFQYKSCAPLFGLFLINKRHRISSHLFGEPIQNSRGDEIRYLESCLSMFKNATTKVLYISTGAIPVKDLLTDVSDKCGLGTAFLENTAKNAEFFADITENNILIIDVETVFHSHKQALDDLYANLSHCGKKIDGTIALI